MPGNESKLDHKIEKLLRYASESSKLLVATDFDGTISTFTEDPALSTMRPVARTALRKLSELPNTFAAVISGRALSDLSKKCSGLEKVRLIGSHGHEFDIDKVAELSPLEVKALRKAEEYIKKAVKNCGGSFLEKKPHGAVFHYRVLKKAPLEIIEKLLRDLSGIDRGIVRLGKKIVEYCVLGTHKGQALSALKDQTHPTLTLFIGDDETDEDAFSSLKSPDVGIKVGKGASLAALRINSDREAEIFLAKLAEKRDKWIHSYDVQKINRHVFLSDMRTVALVDESGSVKWMCAPRADSPPLFGALVGGPASGQFVIKGKGRGKVRYDGNSLISCTSFQNITVTDFLEINNEKAYQRAGRSDLVRIVEGDGEVNIEFAPKFDFGRVPTLLTKIKEGLRIECGRQLMLLLCRDLPWKITREGWHDTARCTLNLKKEKLTFHLLIGTGAVDSKLDRPDNILKETKKFWEHWGRNLKLPKTAREEVRRSALTIGGLCHGPTGSILAAATTSLPETIGGVRNWDYRYCWPRDGAFSASSLLNLGKKEPAWNFIDWILDLITDTGEGSFLRPLYSVTGRVINGEAEVSEAIGYQGSRPVRIGNLASEQLQLDALGPIAELMLKMIESGLTLSTEHLHLAEYLVNLVASRWQDADSGIWEIRSAQRHYVHSKLMCWYTVSCCLKVCNHLGVSKKPWEKLLSEIRDDIEMSGFNKKLGTYVAAYDLMQADAALLWVILSGFHPPDDPRSLGTLRFIEKELCSSGYVYRYKFDDSLQGHEGEFIICRSWLIQALSMCGEKGKARKYFNNLLKMAGPVGLFSEQWDPVNGEALGNYPQAYSHLGLINSAVTLG